MEKKKLYGRLKSNYIIIILNINGKSISVDKTKQYIIYKKL